MPLTDAAIKAIRPTDKISRYHDEKGLYLEVSPAGGKWWRFKYTRPSGKENRISLGTYPEVSLKSAREARDRSRLLLTKNIDPAEQRKQAELEGQYLFRHLAKEWFDTWKIGKTPGHATKTWTKLETHLFPDLGNKAVNDIDGRMVMDCVKKPEAEGHYDLAHVLLNKINQMYRYAIARGKAKANPAAVKPSDVLVTVESKHRPSIHPRELPQLLKDIDQYDHHDGKRITLLAMKIMNLTFIRTTELITSPWPEIDGSAMWVIPPERMKMPTPHYVPLARQTRALLDELRELTGAGKYLFPGEQGNACMSNNTILFALYRMGYRGRMTGHGFRSVASTILHEHDWPHQHIELQLAHMERDEVSAAYNHAKYLKQRAEMMQWWADFLDQQRALAG